MMGKKTVVDAVNALGANILTLKDWNHVLFLKHVGAFHISAGNPNIINKNDTEFVCHRCEFEMYVDSLQNGKKTIVDAVEQEGEKWTHLYTDDTGTDIRCKLLAEHGEWAWIEDAGTVDTIRKSWLKPIKPTINNKEYKLLADYAHYLNCTPVEFDQYISETYDVIN